MEHGVLNDTLWGWFSFNSGVQKSNDRKDTLKSFAFLVSEHVELDILLQLDLRLHSVLNGIIPLRRSGWTLDRMEVNMQSTNSLFQTPPKANHRHQSQSEIKMD